MAEKKEVKKPYTVNGEKVTLEQYRKTRFEDMRLRVPKGKKKVIELSLDKLNEKSEKAKSMNSFLYEAIRNELINKTNIDIEEYEAIPTEWDDTPKRDPIKWELKKK